MAGVGAEMELEGAVEAVGFGGGEVSFRSRRLRPVSLLAVVELRGRKLMLTYLSRTWTTPFATI